jgi:Rad3-related DNA helicase
MSVPISVRRKNPVLRKKIKLFAAEITTLNRTIHNADAYPNDFYCTWDEKSFKLVPMTARLYFKRLFLRGKPHRPVIMSATIGNAETFSRELGISNMYDFIEVESAFPPESMPVWTLRDAPKLGHRTTPLEWDHWADVIGKAIDVVSSDWSGIIHVASKFQAKSLAEKLYKKFGDRVYIPQGKTTRKKIQHWHNRKKKHPNTLAISYSFFMGLDAYDDEINIIAKIPFATLDEVGMAKLEYDRDIYTYNAALLTEQAAGRIRRGKPEHYEDGGRMKKFVAIADGNYSVVKPQFSNHFKKCLTSL